MFRLSWMGASSHTQKTNQAIKEVLATLNEGDFELEAREWHRWSGWLRFEERLSVC